MPRLRWALAIACTFSALAAAACGGSRSASGGGSTRLDPAPTSRNNLVTGDEISKHGGHNLHEILRALRPAWFRMAPTRMTTRMVYADGIAVYLDGRRMGTAEYLSEIPVSMVGHVRWYSAGEAQGRFGLDNLQGAIEVITAR